MSDSSLKFKQAADYTTFKASVGIILFSVVLYTGCGSAGPQNTASATNWQIVTFNFSNGAQNVYSLAEYPWKAGTSSDGSVWLNFPRYDSAAEAFAGENVVRLWKIYADRPGSLADYQTVSFSFSVSADDQAQFFWETQKGNTCSTPAAAHPMFTASYHGAFQATDEWWANPASFPLSQASGVLQVPMTPDQWSDRDGVMANYNQATLSGFNYARANTLTYGVSFGGGCFFGHGVSTIGGNARFELQTVPPAS